MPGSLVFVFESKAFTRVTTCLLFANCDFAFELFFFRSHSVVVVLSLLPSVSIPVSTVVLTRFQNRLADLGEHSVPGSVMRVIFGRNTRIDTGILLFSALWRALLSNVEMQCKQIF
jgi:hypothetical protein